MRKKTTILVENELWTEFVTYVVRKYGTSRKTSEEIEAAMREYLEKRGTEDDKHRPLVKEGNQGTFTKGDQK